MPSGKAGTAGGKVLARMAEVPPEDTLVMILTNKLDNATRSSKWYRATESKGIHLQLWPVAANQLPGWIAKRLEYQGFQASKEALHLLADRVEGNLLAAEQEIRKIGMLLDNKVLDVEDVMSVVTDNARHNIFGFIDAALSQQIDKLSRMLGHIRAEGVQPPVVLWAMARDLRLLFLVADALIHQRNPDQALDAQRVWKSRRQLLVAAGRRKQAAYWAACLSRCSKIDRMIKGIADGNPWDELLQLGFRLAR
jgi:DNA polymerase-3 subunit delta